MTGWFLSRLCRLTMRKTERRRSKIFSRNGVSRGLLPFTASLVISWSHTCSTSLDLTHIWDRFCIIFNFITFQADYYFNSWTWLMSVNKAVDKLARHAILEGERGEVRRSFILRRNEVFGTPLFFALRDSAIIFLAETTFFSRIRVWGYRLYKASFNAAWNITLSPWFYRC